MPPSKSYRLGSNFKSIAGYIYVLLSCSVLKPADLVAYVRPRPQRPTHPVPA